MQPREYDSKNIKTFGIASIDVNLYPADFMYNIIDFIIAKTKQDNGS
jgi:hypothetical protein